MRKGIIRRIALNLAIVMLLTLLPAFGGPAGLATTASAYDSTQRIYVGYQTAKEVSFYYYESASGTGWYYDPYEQALYLTNYNGGGIYAGDELTVYTSGTCTVNGGQYTFDGITYGGNAFAVSGESLYVYVQSGTLTATGGNSNYRSGSALQGGTIYLNVASGATAKMIAGQTIGSYNGEYHYGADAISAYQGVTIYNDGTLTVTAKDAVFWGGFGVYCGYFNYYGSGTATITAGNTTGADSNGGSGIGAGGEVWLSGTGSLTVKGGNASTGSSTQRTGGAAVASQSDINIGMGCTLTGGNGYYAGAAIGTDSAVNFYANSQGAAITLTAGSGKERWALRCDEDYSVHYALNETALRTADNCCYQLKYTVKDFTMTLDGDGGRYSGATTKTITAKYNTLVDLSAYPFAMSGYTLAAWYNSANGRWYLWNARIWLDDDTTMTACYVQRQNGDVLLLPGTNGGLIDGYIYYYEPSPGTGMSLPTGSQYPLLYGTGKTTPTFDTKHVNQSPVYAEWYDVNTAKQNTLYAYTGYIASSSNLVIYYPTDGAVKQGGNVLWQVATDELTTIGESYLTAPSGKELAGWSTYWDGPVVYEPGDIIPYDSYNDVTRRLYAVWQPITYTLTLSGNGGTVNGMSSIQKKLSADKWYYLSDVDVYRSGYSLIRWQDSSAGTYYPWNGYLQIKKNTTLNAQYQQRKAGDLLLLPGWWQHEKILNGSTASDYVYYSSGTSVTLPTKDASGRDITWSFDSNAHYYKNVDGLNVYTEPVYSGKYAAPTSEQTTLYAQAVETTASWSSLVVYHATDGKAFNGGDLLMQERQSKQAYQTRWHDVISDAYLTAPEDYRFAGWATSPNGVAQYQPYEQIPMEDDEVFHLYAVWEPSAYTLTLNGNGGTVNGVSSWKMKTELNGWAALSDVDVYRAGNSLRQWYDSSTGTYYPWNGYVEMTRNATLAAQYQSRRSGDLLLLPGRWQRAKIQDGNTAKDYVYYSSGASVTLPATNANGKDITWSFDANAHYYEDVDWLNVYTEPVYSGKYAASTSGQTTLYSQAVETTASWSSLIVYHPTDGRVANGGDLLMQEMRSNVVDQTRWHNVINGEYLIAPTGYELAGWATSPNGEVTYLPFAQIPMDDDEVFHLYAVWEQAPYTLTLNGNGGTVNGVSSLQEKIKAGYEASLFDVDVYRSGYSLIRWQDSSTGTYYPWAAWFEMTKDTTLNAQYQQRKNGDLLLLPGRWEQERRIQVGATAKDYVYYASGASVTLPTTNANGRDITWSFDSNAHYYKNVDGLNVYTEPVYSGKYAAPTSEQTTLYAQAVETTTSWSSLVVYHATDGKAFNGGDLLMQELRSEQPYQFKSHTVIDESYLVAPVDYEFAGWATSPNGAIAYLPYEQIALEDDDVLHLYAVWVMAYDLENGWRGAYDSANGSANVRIPEKWLSIRGAKYVVASSYDASGKYLETVALRDTADMFGDELIIAYNASQHPETVFYVLDKNWKPLGKYTATVAFDRLTIN